MAQFDLKQQVFAGDKRQFYSYDEELYTATFPFEWAENHLPGTGPKECGNCACYGSWNGVFIGYCSNCAHYQYNGERGKGFIDYGTENNSEELANFVSVFDTYLKGVDLDDVGDKDFIDTVRVMRDREENQCFIDSETMMRGVEYVNHLLDGNCDSDSDSDSETESESESDSEMRAIDEANAYATLLEEEERAREDSQEVGWFIDRFGCGYGSHYDGGYDSY